MEFSNVVFVGDLVVIWEYLSFKIGFIVDHLNYSLFGHWREESRGKFLKSRSIQKLCNKAK